MRNIIFYLFIFVCGCKNSHEQKNNDSLIAKEDSVQKEALPVLSKYFSQNGYLGYGDIVHLKAVGIVHEEDPIPVPFSGNLMDTLWKDYFRASNDNPEDVILALEAARGNALGEMYRVGKPKGFITPYMFTIGLRKAVICDMRSKTETVRSLPSMAIQLFLKRGGQILIENLDVEKCTFEIKLVEPVLTNADREWIRKEWYAGYFKENLEYEDRLVQFSNRNDVIVVAGASHVFALYLEQRIQSIALAILPADLALVIEIYYIELYFHQKIILGLSAVWKALFVCFRKSKRKFCKGYENPTTRFSQVS